MRKEPARYANQRVNHSHGKHNICSRQIFFRTNHKKEEVDPEKEMSNIAFLLTSLFSYFFCRESEQNLQKFYK